MVRSYTSFPRDNNAKRLCLAFCVTLIFMITEVVGGLISGSLALLADAGHMLTDAVAMLFALLAIQFARRPPSEQHTFGWLRLTTLSAFVNAIALVIVTIFIIWEAVRHFYHPQPVSGTMMIFVAVTGLITNILVFWILHRGDEEKNLSVRAAALHVLGDLLGSIGAIITALVVLWTGWSFIDSVLSVLVSCLVLRSAWRLLKKSVNELLEGAPVSVNIPALKHNLCCTIPEVNSVHHVHIWQIGEKLLMTLHVWVISPHDHCALLSRIQLFLKNHYQIVHATIQLEYQPCNALNCSLCE